MNDNTASQWFNEVFLAQLHPTDQPFVDVLMSAAGHHGGAFREIFGASDLYPVTTMDEHIRRALNKSIGTRGPDAPDV